MERKHYPGKMIEVIRETLDCNPVFHGKCGKCKSDDWYYDGKYSCIWNYLYFYSVIGQVTIIKVTKR